MACSTKELNGYSIATSDGEIGHVQDVYFDDRHWTIRHVVVDTGGWITGRQVLVSPHSIQRLDRQERRLEVALTRHQIEQAPGVDTELPVSRQHAYDDYFGYPYYWLGTGVWGEAAYPMLHRADAMAAGGAETAQRVAAKREDADPHLRSAREVSGYAAVGTDGSIGQVEEFLFDERSWQIQAAVVDTRTWWPGGQVLVDIGAIEVVDWSRRELRLALTREAVRSMHPYRPPGRVKSEEELMRNVTLR